MQTSFLKQFEENGDETQEQIQESGIAFEFGKVSNKRARGEIETERRNEELKVH